MIPDDRREPMIDEYGGVWQFYKRSVPNPEGIVDFEISYTLRFPSEIHNYIIDTYVGIDEQGPLRADFHISPQMIEDIVKKWEAMDGDRPTDMLAFRAAIYETTNHRYHLPPEDDDLDLSDLSEQRESVLNEPLDLEQAQVLEEPPPPSIDGKPIDIESIYLAIDQGQLGDVGPEQGDAFVRQDLLEPAPLNFGQSVRNFTDYIRERWEGFRQTINDTFGR